jgi:Flp pilus assembly protein TadG
MLLRSPSLRRRGAAAVETAIVYSVVLLLTIGVIIVALGMHDYHQVAALAREGARWASVHGGQYKQETGNALATPATVYSNAIEPLAAGLDRSQLTYSVTWDQASEMPTYVNSSGNVVPNNVTVTVTYRWVPALYLSPVNMTSTSVMAVQY